MRGRLARLHPPPKQVPVSRPYCGPREAESHRDLDLALASLRGPVFKRSRGWPRYQLRYMYMRVDGAGQAAPLPSPHLTALTKAYLTHPLLLLAATVLGPLLAHPTYLTTPGQAALCHRASDAVGGGMGVEKEIPVATITAVHVESWARSA